MYVFPPGSGCTGLPRLVHPGEELNLHSDGGVSNDGHFDSSQVNWGLHAESSCSVPTQNYIGSLRPFNLPLDEEVMDELKHKKFAPDTEKKIKWAVKMFRDWRNFRNSCASVQNVQ